MSKISAHRFHDISCGHRVVGQGGKCEFLHGHNYRIHFYCIGVLDNEGRVIDFGVIKERLCCWLENHWDHKMVLWVEDPVAATLTADPLIGDGVLLVPFNPTAENMADHLLTVIGPEQLQDTGVTLVKVVVEETRKCSASAEIW